MPSIVSTKPNASSIDHAQYIDTIYCTEGTRVVSIGEIKRFPNTKVFPTHIGELSNYCFSFLDTEPQVHRLTGQLAAVITEPLSLLRRPLGWH
jgi:hypothetical protein